MDERPKKALDFANYPITLGNQQRNNPNNVSCFTNCTLQ